MREGWWEMRLEAGQGPGHTGLICRARGLGVALSKLASFMRGSRWPDLPGCCLEGGQ